MIKRLGFFALLVLAVFSMMTLGVTQVKADAWEVPAPISDLPEPVEG